jgi:dTDP-4-dehydrorhamnose 3,5-epimerase
MIDYEALWAEAAARPASVTTDWHSRQRLIDGVAVKEIRPVLGGGGGITEVWRADWALDEQALGQVFMKTMVGHAISGWHAHEHTTDRLFVAAGQVRIVLFDARPGSASQGLINEFVAGTGRPALVVIPPGVWHAVRNEHPREAALVLNLVDVAYCYEQPDHRELALDHPDIPYRFPTR